MGFKLAKASGVRIPDFVDHVPAASGFTHAEMENGVLVAIVSGAVDLYATSGVAVAGILALEAGAARYAGPGSAVYTPTMKNKDQTVFMPVTTTLLIEADWNTTATATPVIGGEYDIVPATMLIDPDVTTNGDFRVVNFKYDKAGNISKLLGFFTSTGYFVS